MNEPAGRLRLLLQCGDYTEQRQTSDQFIPVAAPDLTGNEEAYVVDAIRSSWISSTGKYVDRFESEFAVFCKTSSALSVCNGTVALHLALLALDVRPGDEVLVPALTYVATANAVRYVGAEPVFVDVDPATWCIDPTRLEEKITRRTRGIIAVHLYGHPADMDPILHIASVNGLWVVEDAAEAHMATYKGRPTGSLGHIATFSFYGNKLLTSGEGGAITLSDDHLAGRIRALRGQGMDPARRYYFPIVGYNFRLTNIACALLCAQLERRESIRAQRMAIYKLYEELLSDIPGIGMQPHAPWASVAPWLFCVTVGDEYGISRDALATLLAANRVETRPFFMSLHELPPYREESRRRGDSVPTSSALSATGLNLPTFNSLTTADIGRIAGVIRRARR